MKLVQINPVLRRSTSTGRIMEEIGDLAMAKGWKCYAAYSRGRDGMIPTRMIPLPVGSGISTVMHGLSTRIFDRHGLGSTAATKAFIGQLRNIQPDIVHIHNIHGYFLNYPMLFQYLKANDVRVMWTVHDCWLYTGHCYHYAFAGCDRWQTGCGHCPQRGAFPRSWLIDRSARNFTDKKKAFTSLRKDRFVIVTVSDWMRNEIKQSFLKDYDCRVIHNGIDLTTFAPVADVTAVKRKYGITDRHTIILGLASIWSREKGLDDFIRMAGMLTPDEQIVLAGVDGRTRRRLPGNILAIRRTDNVGELAALYSAATVFVNPTWQDNYPTVNLEATACGTPVVSYRTGGSVESITPATGRIVEQGDVDGLLKAVRGIASAGKEAFTHECRNMALRRFSKEDRYQDYFDLYEELLHR